MCFCVKWILIKKYYYAIKYEQISDCRRIIDLFSTFFSWIKALLAIFLSDGECVDISIWFGKIYTSMKHCHLFLFLVIWLIAGCETPQPGSSVSETLSIEGLKISDLKDGSSPANTETLMSFRVLTYTVASDLVDELKEIVDSLSRSEVRAANKGAFNANGFSIGVSSFEGGAKVAQKLARMGAVRTGQSRMVFPVDKTEVLSRTFLQGTEIIHYSKSASSTATITPGQGVLGWIFSARPDPRFRGMAQIKLFPATWQPGGENIRLVMGKDAVDYQPIYAGQVLARVEEGGVILLGPARSVPDEMTLDKGLFFIPGKRPEVQFFVIICDSVGI